MTRIYFVTDSTRINAWNIGRRLGLVEFYTPLNLEKTGTWRILHFAQLKENWRLYTYLTQHNWELRDLGASLKTK